MSLNQYLKLIDRKRIEFKPGLNQVSQDFFFRLLSKKAKPIFFVQIGANDGVRNDPVHAFIKKYNWTGILVEPLPDMFEKLKIAYQGNKELIFENVGISGQSGEMNFYFLPPQYNDPDWLQQIGTFDPKAIDLNLKNFPTLLEKIETRGIRTVTLKELLERNSVSEFDLLIVDAEGFEYEILSQLDQLIKRPSYILFEWGCMNEDTQNRLFEFLRMQTTAYTQAEEISSLSITHTNIIIPDVCLRIRFYSSPEVQALLETPSLKSS